MRPWTHLVPVVALALAVMGCAGDLLSAWEVKDPELMVARVQVEGEPLRARPRPGERAEIRFQVGSDLQPPAGALPEDYLDLAAALCLGVRLPDGTLACVTELPLDTAGQRVVSVNELAVPFELPAFVADAFEQLMDQIPDDQNLVTNGVLMFGAVCVEGRARRIEGKEISAEGLSQVFECVDNGDAAFPEPLTFTLTVRFDLDGESSNRNPDFACQDDSGPCAQGVPQPQTPDQAGPIVLVRPGPEDDDFDPDAVPPGSPRVVLWESPARPPRELPHENCADDPAFAELKVQVGGPTHKIRIRFDPSDRESVGGRPEQLQISHALTEGDGNLDSHFSFVDPETPDAEAEVEVEYTPPGEEDVKEEPVPASGRLVRFFIDVRDLRGGADFTTRALCLLPRP